MADGYGSKANPVAQDPFQQIVGVHWKESRSIFAVAFAVRLQTYSNATSTYLRYWNPQDYHIVRPPLTWGAFVLDEAGWGGALAELTVDGLPPHGPPPDYFWPSPAEVDHARWANPAGGDLEILAPVIGDGDTVANAFKAGIAGIDNYDGAGNLTGSLTSFPIDAVTATYAQRTFEYAGAVAVPKVIPGANNLLIGGPGVPTDFELWCLCTATTS